MPEELLKLAGMKSTTKGEDIFNVLKTALTENGLSLKHLVGITTDGAPAMTGSICGIVLL